MSRPVGTFNHGTVNRYTENLCRCDPCREAWHRQLKLRRRYPSLRDPARVLADPEGPAFVPLARILTRDEWRSARARWRGEPVPDVE